jgi:hypothetical protein
MFYRIYLKTQGYILMPGNDVNYDFIHFWPHESFVCTFLIYTDRGFKCIHQRPPLTRSWQKKNPISNDDRLFNIFIPSTANKTNILYFEHKFTPPVDI